MCKESMQYEIINNKKKTVRPPLFLQKSGRQTSFFFQALFNLQPFLIVSISKLCFRKWHHHITGHETCAGMFVHKLCSRRQEPTTIVLQEGHLTNKRQDSVGYFNIALDRGGGNLNDFLFNSSSMVERTQFFLVDTLLQYFCRKILVTKPAGACQKRITTVYKLFWSDSGVHELLCFCFIILQGQHIQVTPETIKLLQ